MFWNIVKVEDLLLGKSLHKQATAEDWQKAYTKKYPSIKFAIVQTDVEQTCDVPTAGAYRPFGSQK